MVAVGNTQAISPPFLWERCGVRYYRIFSKPSLKQIGCVNCCVKPPGVKSKSETWLFPGWWVDYTGPKGKTTRVLNPKALPTFLDNERMQLSAEEIHLASSHLSRSIRVFKEYRRRRVWRAECFTLRLGS
jgi:hypothetical protein